MKQGDIILVPFPLTYLSSQKTRPALIVSQNNRGQDLIIVAITSKRSPKAVKIDNDSLVQGKLPVASFVRYDKIVTLHKSLVRKQVARLKGVVLDLMVNKLRSLF